MAAIEIRLTGTIRRESHLMGAIQQGARLTGRLLLPVGYTDYIGPYDVTPKVTAQELATQDKRMTQNVRVLEIPYFEVSNAAKGETIYIATEVVTNGN